MELPQSRPQGAEGKKPAHDFLSLYSFSSFPQEDPAPSQGFYLKTHDFLQPLELAGNGSPEKESREMSAVEKLSSVEKILPAGIGTYSIGHISSLGRGVVKPERNACTTGVEETKTHRNEGASKTNSNCSSHNGGGGFTPWDESAHAKEMSKVNVRVGEGHITREPSEKPAQFPALISGSSGFESMASSKYAEKKNKGPGFMEMIRGGNGLTEDEYDDEDDYPKKESSLPKLGDTGVKMDVKGHEQKPNTLRSKHSATEQRRRCKINDRFQILRQIMPHTDQKRDKASFLLEVIEYIQFLQDRVLKYEAAFPGWNQDSMKFKPWKDHNHGLGESTSDHSRAMKNSAGSGSGLMFAHKFDNNNVAVATSMLGNLQNPVRSDNMSTRPFHPYLADKGVSTPVPSEQNIPTNSGGKYSGIVQPQQRLMSDAENMTLQSHHNLWQRSCPADSDILNEHKELAIEGGTIRVSSVYSQGLLTSLSQALHSTGIDLSHASISVQIDLGKRATNRPSSTTSSSKDHEEPSSCNRAMAHSRVASSSEDSEQAHKRLKTDSR